MGDNWRMKIGQTGAQFWKRKARHLETQVLELQIEKETLIAKLDNANRGLSDFKRRYESANALLMEYSA